jgi:predicted nucleic acid-binding protein
MPVTYLDSGVLIALAQGTEARHDAARRLVADPARRFVSSDMNWLETMPHATFQGGREVAAIYEAYFTKRVANFVIIDAGLVLQARTIALETGIGGADAIHAAAALRAGADELITTEKVTKPLFRLIGIKVLPL